MKEPKVKEFNYCIADGCKGKPKLVLKTTTKLSRYKNKYWSYECPICKESFTTTESDTISLNEQLKPKNK